MTATDRLNAMNERDKRVIASEELRARTRGLIGSDGTRIGSARGHRTMVTAPSTSRRRCSCGCGKRATHVGLGDGIALMGGCQWRVRQWVRDGQ